MHFFQLLSEFVGHQAGRGHSQYNEGDLTALWPLLGTKKSDKLGFGPRGSSFVPVTRDYSSIRALRRRHLRSGRRVPDDGGPHFSSRGAQSVFETILPARPAAVQLLGRDACALH